MSSATPPKNSAVPSLISRSVKLPCSSLPTSDSAIRIPASCLRRRLSSSLSWAQNLEGAAVGLCVKDPGDGWVTFCKVESFAAMNHCCTTFTSLHNWSIIPRQQRGSSTRSQSRSQDSRIFKGHVTFVTCKPKTTSFSYSTKTATKKTNLTFTLLTSDSLRRKTAFMRKNPLPVKTIAICRDVSSGTQTLRNRDSVREFYGRSEKLE